MRARPILALMMLAALVSPRGYAARGEVYALVGGRVFPVSGPPTEPAVSGSVGASSIPRQANPLAWFPGKPRQSECG